ncbi:MAG: hypothetical protein WCG55_02925 [bacterium]
MKKTIGDHEWKKMAEKNAKHLANLHIETHNAKKIAEVFKDISTVTALEYLFEQAEKYRKENKHSKVAAILEAANLIDRTTGLATEITLKSKGSGKNQDSELYVRRYTPTEIFEEPITYREIIEEA